MRHSTSRRSLLVAAAVALVGCADTPPLQPPKIERLTGAALAAKIPAPVAVMSTDDIVAMAQRGESAAAIIVKLDASHSHYRLDAGQIAAMIRHGVAPQVIDHMLEGERRRIFDDTAAEIARRDQACLERVEQEASQSRLQSLAQCWAGHANCWPPHAGFPYWRCY